METDRVLPVVGLLQAISPDPNRPDNETLTYPSLRRAVRHNQTFEQMLVNTFYTAEDEYAQLRAAKKLAEYELIETADALQQAQTLAMQHDLSRRFTQASVNLFGEPDQTIALYLLERLLTELCILQTNPWVDLNKLNILIHEYSEILERSQIPRRYVLPFEESAECEAAVWFGRFLHERYEGALAAFVGDLGQELAPLDIAERFEQGLGAMRVEDKMWDEWSVVLRDRNGLAVNPISKHIIIGKQRAMSKLGDVLGLFGHEVLVHALRSLNGARLHKSFATGLPGYDAVEEGLGCFVEHALVGRRPQRMCDRYLDIALTMGILDGTPRTRKKLFQLVYLRAVVRAQANGDSKDVEDTKRRVWAHVNRIFRGTLGNGIVGVFTRDIVYYTGYQSITRYIIDDLETVQSVEELWAKLTLGKYDPTNPMHILQLIQYSS